MFHIPENLKKKKGMKNQNLVPNEPKSDGMYTQVLQVCLSSSQKLYHLTAGEETLGSNSFRIVAAIFPAQVL